MQRFLLNDLILWKNSKRRKPLLLQGARQVGKTFLLKNFGNNEYENLFYVNFEETEDVKRIFENTLDPDNIIEQLTALTAKKIDVKNCLLFFDEIQLCPRAITSLKYFFEKKPHIHLVAAGSLLGVSLGKDISFPVGKVNFKTLYPLSFQEFLMAVDESALIDVLTGLKQIKPIPDVIHKRLLELYQKYLFIGGMPEVVEYYRENRDFVGVREIQDEILESYQRDFSKYANVQESIKIIELWRTIPGLLSKENKKFTFSAIKKGSRLAQYRAAIEWLRGAGLIHLAYNCKKAALPLGGYSENNKFKIYLSDTGLLGAMLNIHSKVIIKVDKIFSEYNGAFIENFTAIELVSFGLKSLHYWTSKSDAEVDFLLDFENIILPLEVKSGLNRNIKSLRSYADKYSPKYIFRVSPRNFTNDKDFVNIPIYAVGFFFKYLDIILND